MEMASGNGISRKIWIGAGLALSFVALASNAPYAALISLFDYDDVLRRSAADVLTKFHEAGTPLVLAWWAFALCAVGFALAAAALGEALKGGRTKLSPAFTMFGVLSGVLQAMALFRWTFAIPQLAAAHAAAPEGSAERIAIETTYSALNGFAGVNIGEHLGQILLMVWTLGIGLAVMRQGGAMKWIGMAGLATLPFWIVGQTELLATAIPEMPVIETIPYAYMAWEAWLLVLGVAMVVKAVRGDVAAGAVSYA
ncbi:MAG: DUF4386 domain-containing protein [Hyphomonadaceae bacterium]|nr:DUF4386 domain-containing protein [Hyphomonadaceae bacterium]